MHVVSKPRRIGLALGAIVGMLGYVWVAAVQSVPRVRRRKDEARARRRA